jgi:hypothetical protein
MVQNGWNPGEVVDTELDPEVNQQALTGSCGSLRSRASLAVLPQTKKPLRTVLSFWKFISTYCKKVPALGVVVCALATHGSLSDREQQATVDFQAEKSPFGFIKAKTESKDAAAQQVYLVSDPNRAPLVLAATCRFSPRIPARP